MPFDATGYTRFDPAAMVVVLRAARDGITTAWCQNVCSDGYGHCAMSWLREVSHSYTQDSIAPYVIRTVLEPLIEAQCGRYVSISEFNDSHSKAEVIALFDQAIEQMSEVLSHEARR